MKEWDAAFGNKLAAAHGGSGEMSLHGVGVTA